MFSLQTAVKSQVSKSNGEGLKDTFEKERKKKKLEYLSKDFRQPEASLRFTVNTTYQLIVL